MTAILGIFATVGGWFGLSGRLAKWAGGAALLVALLLLLWGAKALYDASVVAEERARVAAEQAEADRRQREAEREAEDARRAELRRAETEADQRQKEIDNATRNIPDQGLSPRQRARVCLELRRQGASERDLAAACGPV